MLNKLFSPEQKAVLKRTENRPFMTSGEIIKLAKVHPNTMAMWRKTGKIVPKDRIGASYLYDKEEVLQFLDSRTRFKRNGKK